MASWGKFMQGARIGAKKFGRTFNGENMKALTKPFNGIKSTMKADIGALMSSMKAQTYRNTSTLKGKPIPSAGSLWGGIKGGAKDFHNKYMAPTYGAGEAGYQNYAAAGALTGIGGGMGIAAGSWAFGESELEKRKRQYGQALRNKF